MRYLLVSVGMLGVGTAGLLLLFSCIPDGLIPSQWSDFEFWGTAGKDFLRAVSDYIAAAKYRPDLHCFYRVLQASFGILSAHFVMCIYGLIYNHFCSRPVQFVQVVENKVDQLPYDNASRLIG